MEKIFDDKSIMPFGQHKGKALANVPASYLLHAYDQNWLYGGLKKYVEDNKAVLQKQNTQAKETSNYIPRSYRPLR